VPGKLGTLLGIRDQMRHEQHLQAELLANVDAFVLLTQWAHDTVAANAGNSARLSLNRLGTCGAIAEPKPSPELRPTKRPILVGYLGRFDSVKGVHDLARAFASLPRELEIRLEFRGPAASPAERQVLRELQGILGEDRRVVFQPAVPSDQVYQCLRDYDVLCCPSVCVEGGPTVAIEAHAVGTPVIGTRIGGLAELITDHFNGRLVRPGDWRGLASVLAKAANDPAGTIDRWRLALPPARTMDEIAADYLALYEGRS
jgi:glycosyltransferase involved in cell wall biosynthesis